MHDESPEGVALRTRTLDAWHAMDAALRMAEGSQNRSRTFLLVRAASRLAVGIIAVVTVVTCSYLGALILLLTAR